MKVVFLVAAITILALGIVWMARRNNSATQLQAPTNDVRAENLNEPIGLVGGRAIDPVPPNQRRSFTPAENTRIVNAALVSTRDFPTMIPQAKTLNLQFGINRGTNTEPSGTRDPNAGRPVFILYGDNTFSCSAYAPDGRLLQDTCQWVMVLDATTGEALFITQSRDVFCQAGKVIC